MADTMSCQKSKRNMKILRKGNLRPNIFRGTCDECNAVVKVERCETREMIDRDTAPGMATRYVRCPTRGCQNFYLWVFPFSCKSN